MRAAEYLAAKAAAMTEAELLDGILGTPRRPGVALALGWRGYHTHRAQHSPAGFPDLCLVRPPRLAFAELKRQAAKYQPTPDQVAWLEDLTEVRDRIDAIAGVYPIGAGSDFVDVYLWRPLDLLDGTIAAALK